jgi:maltose alpha-D-glucosyltransferase/alpha-amylase
VLSSHAGARIRHHGDYHLGQVLRAQSGEFMVIDFEGEPARPLAERRRRHSPLRDVAGMLRSFAYAAATLSTEVQQQHDASRLAQRASRWERGVRDAFLNGYLNSGDPGGARFLPDESKHIDALIALFETEKVFYELGYELNNRPAWVWIPLRGAVGLLIRGAAI